MKHKLAISLMTFVAIAVAACSFSTANISSFKTSKDKEGTQESTTFKGGETMYARAVISNAGKVSVNLYLVADDVAGMPKGSTVPGSEVKLDLPSSGNADYKVAFPPQWGGKFTVVAEMTPDGSDKKETKKVGITVEASAAPAPAAAEDKDGGKADAKEEAKDSK
ncbi:hypothetical protein BH11PSE11_BH11PSE11_16100 [soil metagenome]